MLIFMFAALLPALFVFFVLFPSTAPPFVRRFVLTLLTTAARTFPPTNAEDCGPEYDEEKQRMNADDYTAPQQQQHALIVPSRGHAAQTAPAEAVQRRFSIGRRESNIPSASTPPSRAEVTVSLASALGLSTPPTLNGVERRLKKRGAHTANAASERPRRRRRHDDDTSRHESPRDGAVVRPSKRRADILVAAKSKRANVTNEPPPPPPADTDADDTDVMTDDSAPHHSQPVSAPSPRSVAVILADAPPPQPSRRLHFSSNRNRASPTTTAPHSTQYPQRRDVERIIRSGMVKPSKYERNIMREERKRKRNRRPRTRTRARTCADPSRKYRAGSADSRSATERRRSGVSDRFFRRQPARTRADVDECEHSVVVADAVIAGSIRCRGKPVRISVRFDNGAATADAEYSVAGEYESRDVQYVLGSRRRVRQRKHVTRVDTQQTAIRCGAITSRSTMRRTR